VDADVFRALMAVVPATGGPLETVFMLTWDDWGGFDDHVATPVTEYTRTTCSSPSVLGCRG